MRIYYTLRSDEFPSNRMSTAFYLTENIIRANNCVNSKKNFQKINCGKNVFFQKRLIHSITKSRIRPPGLVEKFIILLTGMPPATVPCIHGT